MEFILAQLETLPNIKLRGLMAIDDGMKTQQGAEVFCFLISEQAAPSETTAPRQSVEKTIGLLSAVSSPTSHTGFDAQAKLEQIRTQIKQLLRENSPPNLVKPVSYAGGELHKFEKGTIWWLDRFTYSLQE